MLLHINKQIMLINILLDRKKNSVKSKTIHASVKIIKYNTNKFTVAKVLADTGKIFGDGNNFKMLVLVRIIYVLYKPKLLRLIKFYVKF